jgi:TENA/THI-4/PQQC family
MGETMTADALMSGHISAWQAATVHTFLAGLRDGSLPEHSFDRWLAQDYLFAQAQVRAQSRIAATAPSPTSPSSRAAWSPPLRSSAGLRRWRCGAAWPSPEHPTDSGLLRLPAGRGGFERRAWPLHVEDDLGHQ